MFDVRVASKKPGCGRARFYRSHVKFYQPTLMTFRDDEPTDKGRTSYKWALVHANARLHHHHRHRHRHHCALWSCPGRCAVCARIREYGHVRRSLLTPIQAYRWWKHVSHSIRSNCVEREFFVRRTSASFLLRTEFVENKRSTPSIRMEKSKVAASNESS